MLTRLTTRAHPLSTAHRTPRRSLPRLVAGRPSSRCVSTMPLTELPDVNPGPFTLQGTNVYLLHGRVLIDTAEGGDDFIKLLREAIDQHGASITDIVLSHWHHDHVDGLPEVLRAIGGSPRVHKWPNPDHDANVLEKLQSVLPDAQLHALSEGQRIALDDRGATATITHAPGHTTDSIGIRLSTGELCVRVDADSADSVRLTADTVLGEGTAVFEDLASYLKTLRRLLDWLGEGKDEVRLLPGHGPVIDAGKDRLRTYISHRLEREKQVVEALSKGGAATVGDLVDRVYGPELAEQLKPAAARGLLLILEKLRGEGRVEETDGRWRLTASKM